MSPRRKKPATHQVTCRCRGNGWVCEEHPDQPYGFELPVSCWCEAPGMPCTGIPTPPALPSTGPLPLAAAPEDLLTLLATMTGAAA